LLPALRAAGVDARTFWKPIHLQAPFAACPREATPVSDRLWRAILTLPCSTGLSEADQQRVIAAVRNALN
ncbi:MAG: DegT/DnrJ/EryC1/StrS family aminotransferase, partial [Myxococcota bacterium]